MSDSDEYRDVAWFSAKAVEQFYREGADASGHRRGSPEHARLVDQAGKEGRGLLRQAMAAFADLDHRNDDAAMRQARLDLEEAIAGELGRDEEFASHLRATVLISRALQGPLPSRRPRPVSEDEGHARPADASRDGSFLEAALWVATAAGSGILGNAAYDAVKAAFRKYSRSRGGKAGSRTAADAGQRPAYSADQLTLIAQLAVQARCGELSIAVPRVTDLRRTDMELGESGVVIYLYSARVHATVVVPADGFDSARDISVTLYTPGDGLEDNVS